MTKSGLDHVAYVLLVVLIVFVGFGGGLG